MTTKNKHNIFFLLLFFITSNLFAIENWIDYNTLEKINFGMSKKEVISTLGEPILILGSNDDDNEIYLFYNFHIKNYENKKGDINLNK